MRAQDVVQDSLPYYKDLLLNQKTIDDLIKGYAYFDRRAQVVAAENNYDEEVRALTYQSIGQKKLTLYNEAEATATKALEILDREQLNERRANLFRVSIYNTMGQIYATKNNFTVARDFYEKALALETKPEYIGILQNNIAYSFLREQQFERARTKFTYALKIMDSLDIPDEKARAIHNLGICMIKLNIPGGIGQIKEALERFERINNRVGMWMCFLELSEALTEEDPALAQFYANEAYAIADASLSANEIIATIEQQMAFKDYQNYPQYRSLSDSLEKQQQESINAYMAYKYNYYSEREAKEEFRLAKVREQYLKSVFMLFSALLICGIVGLFFFLRSRSRRATLQEVLHTESRISQQIHDEVANEVFQVMMRVEEEQLDDPALVDDIEKLYIKTRDISKQHSLNAAKGDFSKTLQDLARNFSNGQTRVILNGLSDISWSKMAPVKRRVVFKVLQELLINMKKHSQASLVALRFEQQDKKTVIYYSDNGRGGHLAKGSGLENAENRTRAVGGLFTFDTAPQRGFKAQLYV